MQSSHATRLIGRYLLLPFILLFSGQSPAEPTRVNTGFTPPVSLLLGEIMRATFQRAGLPLVFSEQPAERSIALVARGIDDAECCRIPGAIANDYPDLVQVPELVFTARFSAFAKPPLPKLEGFESLKPYTVATVSGWKILVNNLSRVRPETLHILDNADTLFQVLELDRIDIATYGYLSGKQTLARLGLADKIKPIEPPLARAPLYLFLNIRHAHLVPRLSRAIRALRADGTIERIIQSYDQ